MKSIIAKIQKIIAIKFIRKTLLGFGYSRVGEVSDDQIEEALRCLSLVLMASSKPFLEVVRSMHIVDVEKEADRLVDLATTKFNTLTIGKDMRNTSIPDIMQEVRKKVAEDIARENQQRKK